MHVLAIDVGSYSVKYLASYVDKRRVSHIDMSEIVLRDFMVDHEGMSLIEAQISIVQGIIDDNARPETKILFQASNEMLTTRFLQMPVKNKKKANLMLPFQLEEDIPYSLSEIHYAYRMEPQKGTYSAIVELATQSAFEEFFNLVRDKGAMPQILTSEVSVVENFFQQNPLTGSVCLLDIGHKTTKAYFFFNSRMLITHVSYVGGQHVNEMIAQTYQIDPDEAIMYKHQNAFLLTSAQFETVEPSQREFALAMDKILAPLIADFARWRIGLKVNFGLPLNQVYLCGGSANIKNISNYLTEKWDVTVGLLETFDKVEVSKIDVNPKSKSKFALVNMMASGLQKKNRFINLLSGRFAQASTAEIPLHSFAFIGVRVAAVTAMLAISLLVERIFIEKDVAFINGRMTTLMKNDELGISGRLRRSISTNPKPVYEALMKRQKGIRQEISTLQSAIEIKALTPLVTVSHVAAKTDATLISFSNSDTGEIRAVFTSEKIDDLNVLKESFERSTLKDVVVNVDPEKLQLELTAGQ